MSTHFHQNTPKSNYFNFPLSAFCCPCAHCQHGLVAHGTLRSRYYLHSLLKVVRKNGKFGVGSHDELSQSDDALRTYQSLQWLSMSEANPRRKCSNCPYFQINCSRIHYFILLYDYCNDSSSTSHYFNKNFQHTHTHTQHEQTGRNQHSVFPVKVTSQLRVWLA